MSYTARIIYYLNSGSLILVTAIWLLLWWVYRIFYSYLESALMLLREQLFISSSIRPRMLRTLIVSFKIIYRDAYMGAPTSKYLSKLKQRGTILYSLGNNLISSAPLGPSMVLAPRLSASLWLWLYLWLICLWRSTLTLLNPDFPCPL